MSGRAVHLRRKLVLEGAVRQDDGAGGFSESWVPQGTLWADMRPGYGRARDGAGARLSLNRWRVICRAAPAGAASRPVAGQRFVEGTRIYRIEAVSAWDDAGIYLQCFCREEVAT